MKNNSNKGLLIFLVVFLSIIVLALSALMVLGISGKGGMFGTKLNLIKDGAKSTGKKLGTILRKYI